MLLALCGVAAAADRPVVSVTDLGLRPACYPRYFGRGPGLGWQDVYNQDDAGRLWLLREVSFRGARIPWRVGQTFAGDVSRPVGRLGLRFVRSGHRVTATQARWVATWGRHDEKFPGLVGVEVDGEGLAGAAVRITPGTTGAVGRVRFEWDHPAGDVQATFVMLPDDDRLFVEVLVRPRDAAAQVDVTLCCWPLGKFGLRTASSTSPALPYGKAYELPTGDATVLFADPSFDPKGKSPEGVCGLTYFPDECLAASATRTFPLTLKLALKPPRPGEAHSAHVVLWELLRRRGDEAWGYLAGREAETLAQFAALPGMDAARFAEPRQEGLQQAEQELSDLLRDTKQASLPPCEPVLLPARWAVPAAGIEWRWVCFHTDEAKYYLRSQDWPAALTALRRARAHLASVRGMGQRND